jgi:hypothetical protein
VIGASGIHVDTKNFAKMKDGASDKNIAFLLLEDKAEGPYYHQEWQDMPLTEACLAGEVSALGLKPTLWRRSKSANDAFSNDQRGDTAVG